MDTTLPFRLDREIALISGGGTGIGFAIAECFAAAGARVVVVGRREEVLKDACGRPGPTASYRVHDVCSFDEAGSLVESISGELGRLPYWSTTRARI